MRWVRTTMWVAVGFLFAGLGALNWRAQLQTQQKLDALTAALAERPAPVPAPAPPAPALAPAGSVPRELSKIALPPYVIEAPDLLLVEVIQRRPEVETGRVASGRPADEPVRALVTDRLPVQPISGQYPVRPDGSIGLGFWGSVPVSGLTLEQAAGAIRVHLAAREPLKEYGTRAESLVVIVDVAAYNSKRYYVIVTDAAGEKVFSFPVTGSETVLDALSDKKELTDVGGRRKVWIARRPLQPDQPLQILPVDWAAITQTGAPSTNYQVMPGDRIHVTRAAD
ncbi:polysaccharide biosynthesis/export family protein [Frigoriglobus tundricola]|uniref:Polysaccharide export protein N-terminal domain-containing protein n=1 Tax=Frigoriglobus tundricola TaxID=2774151 RepID=A0A6M5YTS1_9BACT|nr:polysaccharide biosynthesis/export family protein [Frigoriglobus tundricola]QJW96723.1 hypothetical protein FTUN_4282 [Frigoriglobus tundricola]